MRLQVAFNPFVGLHSMSRAAAYRLLFLLSTVLQTTRFIS